MNTKKVINNATWIIGCKIVQSLLGLFISMFTARYLGPSNFGLINYASSLVVFIMPVMQLGLSSTIVQEVINAPENEGKIMGTSLVMTLFSAIMCIVGIFTFVSIVNLGETETILVCSLYSVQLIFQSIEIISYWFQAKLLSKYTSITMLVSYFVVSGYKLFLLMTHKSVYWFAVSHWVDYAIIAFTLLYIFTKKSDHKLSFSWELVGGLFSRSKHYIVSGLMVSVFAQTDRIMLKVLLSDEATGFYSAAMQCAAISQFIFGAIIDSARPLIFSSKKENESLYKKNLVSTYSIIEYLSLAQCVAMVILADFIISILYGADYMSAASILRISIWYTTFAYLGSVRNIWILAEGKQKFLWIINLSGAIANVVLNFFLIPIWGTLGAAIASLCTQIFANIVVSHMIPQIREVNRYLFAGLNPKNIIVLLNVVKKDILKKGV